MYIIDPDERRRAHIAEAFAERDLRPKPVDDIKDFGQTPPSEGYAFVADEHRAENAVAALRARWPEVPLVAYSIHPSPEKIVRAMLYGAQDYLEWPFDAHLLDQAFERLAHEAQKGSHQATHETVTTAASAQVENLTPREREVLALLVQGMSNKSIGKTLGISPRTVEIHRGNMMRKLHAQSAADAVRIAIYAGVDEGFLLQD
ncbi:MAG TPA: LuxR C-terminal-related transcriptional regulator [Croceibacterium sp.]|nr:LuxR C-terminal-related transcriptional regulator [Croceibacterium sp.]